MGKEQSTAWRSGRVEADQEMAPPGLKLKNAGKKNEHNHKRGERHCVSCKLPASLADVPTLLACQKCKAINRQVFYCSKECQAADWKLGKPPHRTICGKKGAIAAAFASAPFVSASVSSPQPHDDYNNPEEEFHYFPPPNPGYHRSPALIYQIQLLKESPGLDYVLIQPDPLPNEGVRLPYDVDDLDDARQWLEFKRCMDRAVSDHSPRDVFKIFQELERMARDLPDGVANLKKQLFKEYGVDVDAVTLTQM
ncbi:hypothetical protein B0H19DRAFT_95366 [Mycena capillaripes]|nr:hypothetical protein B0H19DRAFT_95366 [Mycena capillaripes]